MQIIFRDTMRPQHVGGGGAVTHSVCLGRELAQRSSRLVVHTNMPELYPGCNVLAVRNVSTDSKVIKFLRWTAEARNLSRHVQGGDVVIYANQLEPFTRTPARSVFIVHDIVPLLYAYNWRLFLYFKYRLGRILKSVDHILTVSCNTRNDLVRHYGIDPEKITVAHNGLKPLPAARPEAVDSLQRRWGPFVLYVGSQLPHKNLRNLIRAFRRLRETAGFERYHLLIAGPTDTRYRPALLAEVGESRLADYVHFTGQLEEADLAAAYAAAAALIVPSLYEGFGLTPLEAMAAGTPVCVAKTSSLPEVCSDAALYFDPTDAGEMSAVMARCLSDAALRSLLIARGKERVKQFNWRESAATVLRVAEQLSS